MKKTVLVLLAFVLALSVFGCSQSGTQAPAANDPSNTTAPAGGEAASGLPALTKDTIKVGFIYGSAIGEEGYTYTHNLGRLAVEAMGVETMYKENVPENAECEKAARDLIDQGCNVIYAISFGHMEYISNVADEYPEVYFNHATGYTVKDNMNTYMGRLYEVQYLTGIAAGMRTETGKIGIVTTFPIPEVVRQINAFTLGIRSVNPTATVEVKWTSSWYDPATEKTAANELLNTGCDVIAAYCDTMNPQQAAADKGKWATGCSSPGGSIIPDAYLTAPLFRYAQYYTKDVERILDGTWAGNTFYWLGLTDGVVDLDEITKNCAEGTQAKVDEVKAKILDGSFFVFTGPIKDNEGNERVASGVKLTDEEMLSFDWFVEGVVGKIN